MHRETETDIAIIGGGVGGFAAALSACRMGKRVVLTEETDWIGGQLTSQAVPPDEHRWIEQFGCTRSYRQFREGVRAFYRQHFPLTAEARAVYHLNPGNGGVSRLCAEPRAMLEVLQGMIAPYVHSGRLTVLLRYRPVHAETDGDRIRSVTVQEAFGSRLTLRAPYFLDATECGDLLPLAGVEYVTGAESRSDTNEPHALEGPADPHDIQAFTWCLAMDYLEGENHIIDKPRDYAFWRSYQADFWPDRQLSWVSPNPVTLEPTEETLFWGTEKYPLFIYRRILDRSNFVPGTYPSDISVVNWSQNDYWLGRIYDVPPHEAQRHLEGSRQLSLSLLYWLQTEAPRPDGGTGYPGLRLRPDVIGTPDGLAKAPYIRESRRIRAQFTVLEQHVSAAVRGEQGAVPFPDSVGVGCYRIDLHPSTAGRNYLDISSLPFQIPLGSLLPIRVRNLLPACKNIGTTHITNGCYRLHPVEWNIGESTGALAAYCLDQKTEPLQVRRDASKLEAFQSLLTGFGVELAWPKIGAV
ncbi:FAD dependent oxidoreductase [Paenibacillus mucilaginosus 3016]|uniref:FAD dependent oxidoreductase n=1 Tax=Paenibacillus mucilaginosus 3016 TaxID=1116391 RepID=H6NTB4_9BACL|nr:FAD-dependent oxidoreductase [Paenibacillus mucilaginosus]AFC27576.1 FAD dependent oxidoreductase [Paenibacillus mucilaginosus 3016]WFA16468.1 FAD-dependent oxidoreductase [Paenibacillus mucilaginosus]